METLILDCSKGARKESLLTNLFAMLDDDGRSGFLSDLSNIGADNDRFESIEFSDGVLLINGLTEAQGKVRPGSTEAACEDGCKGDMSHGHVDECQHGHGHEPEHANDHERTLEPERHHERDHEHERVHEHHTIDEVHGCIDSLDVSDKVKADAFGIYGILSQGEAKAHGVDVEDVHFHEVGNLHAIVSIVSICMVVERLGAERIVSTPITTGFGYVDCAHGRLPIPAPATANILVGLPVVAGDVEGELTTPTGAAVVRYFARGFIE